MMRKVPSLVDLCVQVAIDNVRYLGDVGETENHLLERVLFHCTLDQLRHVEDSTKGRDLSPVSDKIWKKFYESQFGKDSMNTVIQRMKQKKVTFKWRKLYEAKLEEREKMTEDSLARIKQHYEQERAKKMSRQVQVCNKVPPSSSKRYFLGGSLYDTKSPLMKKARREFVNSREVKNLACMKRDSVIKNNSAQLPSSSSSSSPAPSKFIKPPPRRFH